MREKLIALSIVKKGNWIEIHKFLQHDRNLSSIDNEQAIKLVEKLDCDVVTIFDNDYPSAWREMPKPPFVMFLKGNSKLLNGKLISIIGGKVRTNYTKREVKTLLKELPNDVVVITGRENGVEELVDKKAKTKITCLASGFNGIEHDVNDLLISELPPLARFDRSAYHRSYQLIAEIGQVICIFELPKFDCRLPYLKYLTEIGKSAFVLPDWKYDVTVGGIELLNLGAKALININDVLTEMEK